MTRPSRLMVGLSIVLMLSATACSSGAQRSSTGDKPTVIAAEDFWGSIASQLGGNHVSVTSIITNPNADPHDYEPTTADAREIASAGFVIEDGIGYDPWVQKLIDANPVQGRDVLNVGDLVGVPVGASESIFAELAPSLGLKLITPPSFLTAISEGTDPTAADKATIDQQISSHEIKVYVYNRQNATPDVQRQIEEATNQGIPVTTITETLVPAGATFQAWQVSQLRSLEAALAKGTGA